LIFWSLLHTFLEVTLILFAVKYMIFRWPNSWPSRALTFAYA
jgi:hypothetical protein